MARQGINTGTSPNDGFGDSLLTGAIKINSNFSEIYTTFGDGNNLVSYVNSSGVSTYSSISGVATYSPTAGVSTYASIAGYSTSSGIATVAQGLTGTPNINAGIITATSFVGDGSSLTGIVVTGGAGSGVIIKDSGNLVGTAGTIDFGNNLTVSTISAGVVTVSGGGESYWTSNLTGIHTFSNVGIGTTIAGSKLTVEGDGRFSGVVTANSLSVFGVSTLSNLQVGTSGTTSLSIGDKFGYIDFKGSNGSSFLTGASIYARVSDTPGFNMPSDLAFATSGFDMPGAVPGMILTRNGEVLLGFGNATGTTEQYLQVDNGGAYIFGNTGIGTTNPTSKLSVVGDVSVTGISTFSSRVDLKQITETVSNNFNTTLSPSTGTLTIDTSLGSVILGDLNASVTTWAFTNVPTENGKATTITIIIDGDTSQTYGDACTVNGSAVSGGIKWSGGTSPTSTNNFDILSFTIVKDGAGTINVFGSGNIDFS